MGIGAKPSTKPPTYPKTGIPVSGVAHNAHTGAGDVFDNFRTQRSTKYHIAAETRQKDAALYMQK
jgi:hypothetical protein